MPSDEITIPLRGEPQWPEGPADVWFELAVEKSGWASLYLGINGGSRPCTQTLRLTLSNLGDPLPELALLAERAFRGELPYVFEIDSEGPETRISLSPATERDRAVLEVRDVIAPAVYLVALVDPRKLGIALAHALRVAIADPDVADRWESWYGDTRSGKPRHTEYFGNAWLRDLVIDRHPHESWFWDGIDTHNATRYPQEREPR
jgi:hypothetical protein